MGSPVRLSYTAAAALIASTGCPLLFTAEAPPSTTAGSTIQVTTQLFAEPFGGGSDQPTACVELPTGWVVSAVRYEASTTGASLDLTGAATFNQGDTDTVNMSARTGFGWHCYRGPSASFGDGAWGVATFDVIAQTNGAFQLRATAGSAMYGLGETQMTHRSILVGGLHEPLDDWNAASQPGPSELRDVVYGGGRFLTVGRRGLIKTSTDSHTWVTTSTEPIDLTAIVYAQGRFWIVGQDEAVISTVDGTSFTRAYTGRSNSYLDSIAYGSVAGGTFVATAGRDVIASVGGTTWSYEETEIGSSLRDVVWGDGKFVAVGSGGVVATSTDGFYWEEVATPGTSGYLNSVGYGNGRYTAAGFGDVYTSTDGESWSAIEVNSGALVGDVEYFDGLWIAVDEIGAVATSTDGLSWNGRAIGAGQPLAGVAATAEHTVVVGRAELIMRSGIPLALPSPASSDLGTVAPGAMSTVTTVRVDNVGTGLLALGTATINGPDFAIANGGCDDARLAPGRSCDIGIMFAPVADGPKSGTVTIATNDPDAPTVRFAVTGLAVTPQPEITLSPESRDLGMVSIGMASATRTFDIGNTGDADLTFTAIGPLSAPFAIVTDGCTGSAVAPASSCTLEVQFTPVVEGYVEGRFDITSNDLLRPVVTASVSGTGTPMPVPDIQVATAIDFGPGAIEVGDSSTKEVTITNMGSADLVIGQLGGSDPLEPPFSISVDGCSSQTVAPAADCRFSVLFAPASEDTFTDSFDIPSNDPDSPVVTSSVTGEGHEPPVMMGTPAIQVADSIAPTDDHRIDFPQLNVGQVATATLTVRNTGDAPLAVAPLRWDNADAAPFRLVRDGCSSRSVAPGMQCVTVLQFVPMSIGSFTNTLLVGSNDPSTPSVSVMVGGSSKKEDKPPVIMSGNKPPDPPKLLLPEDGAEGVEIPTKFRWEDATDPDGDTVGYELVYCTNADFVGCEPTVVSFLTLLDTVYAQSAALGLTLAGLLLLAFGGGRKKAFAVIVATSMMALTFGACGAPRFTEFEVRDLEPATTYYWRVVAKDDKGAASKSVTWRFETK